MRGCILYKRSGSQIPPEAYEIRRLLEEAAGLGIDLTVSAPEQFDLVVTRDDRKSVRIDGEVHPLPDFLLPRMGSGTTYFALAVMRHLERLGVQPLNSSESIEIVKDKLWSIQVLAASQLPIAKTILVKQPFDAELAKTYLGFTNTRGPANTQVQIPLMDKHDAGRRSHYLTVQFSIPDAPSHDELVIALGASLGGRPHHRIGDRYQDLKEMGGEADNPAGV